MIVEIKLVTFLFLIVVAFFCGMMVFLWIFKMSNWTIEKRNKHDALIARNCKKNHVTTMIISEDGIETEIFLLYGHLVAQKNDQGLLEVVSKEKSGKLLSQFRRKYHQEYLLKKRDSI